MVVWTRCANDDEYEDDVGTEKYIQIESGMGGRPKKVSSCRFSLFTKDPNCLVNIHWSVKTKSSTLLSPQ